MDDLGQRVKTRRGSRSLRSLAGEIGLSRTALMDAERGKAGAMVRAKLEAWLAGPPDARSADGPALDPDYQRWRDQHPNAAVALAEARAWKEYYAALDAQRAAEVARGELVPANLVLDLRAGIINGARDVLGEARIAELVNRGVPEEVARRGLVDMLETIRAVCAEVAVRWKDGPEDGA